MKSFDQMADDFMAQVAKRLLPYVLRDYERSRLRMAYMTGLNAGIEFCADVFEPIAREEKGL